MEIEFIGEWIGRIIFAILVYAGIRYGMRKSKEAKDEKKLNERDSKRY